MTVVALLAGGAASTYLSAALLGIPPPRELLLFQQQTEIEECRSAARMVYDVLWAAACLTEVNDSQPSELAGHAECDLPYAKAATVNAWLAQDEKRCAVEVRAGLSR